MNYSISEYYKNHGWNMRLTSKQECFKEESYSSKAENTKPENTKLYTVQNNRANSIAKLPQQVIHKSDYSH